MSILGEIVANRKEQVNRELAHIKDADLRPGAKDLRKPLDFEAALRGTGLSIIAEVKKASPSKGLIRADFDPVEIASSYETHGANCISVLTEETYFQGHNNYLVDIREKVNIPILRKDFIVDPRQIRESYELGADAILLIVSVLTQIELKSFQSLAAEFGLHCLVEAHSERELEIADICGSKVIGVNNRNLKTFKTDINHSIEIKSKIPENAVCVSESGIHTAEDCSRLFASGFDAILVGETLMRQRNPGAHINTLLGKINASD